MQFFWARFPLVLVLSLVSSTNANYGEFVNPPPSGVAKDFSGNVLLSLGSLQKIKWNTSLPRYSINLYQQNDQGNCCGYSPILFVKKETDIEPGGFNWVVQLYRDWALADSSVYFFGVQSPNASSLEGIPLAFSSHYFNITDQIASSPSPIATEGAAATASPSHGADSKAAHVPQLNKEYARLALGLGLGLGFPVVLFNLYLGMWLGKRRWKREVGEERRVLERPEFSETQANGAESVTSVEQVFVHGVELSDSNQRYQLP